ncbi:MAG: DUF1343 domain-containing protein [Chitinophagaceae bacterium]
MVSKISLFFFQCMSLLVFTVNAQPKNTPIVKGETRGTLKVLPGAHQVQEYLPLIKGKRVAIFANQTSAIDGVHLVDTLMKLGVDIKKIFSPEHGFRGDADAGEHVSSSVDAATGIPIISLYGDHKKATITDLADVDVLIFDLQDVGLRYYTYINNVQECMESAIAANKPMIILDRPNPNGFFVDGPVLEDGFQSGVGKQQVPIVYGMTMAEYASYLYGEKLLNKTMYQYTDGSPAVKMLLGMYQPLKLTIVKCKNYDHNSFYAPPIKPSPNLPNMQSVLLYSSICFFEGTEVSLGRGTDKPFQIYGAPSFPDSLLFRFKPVSTPGAKNPPLQNRLCHGYDLSNTPIDITKKENRQINLSYLLHAYELYPDKDSFFLRPKKGNPSTSDYFFNKLAGNDQLMWQVMNGKSEAEIRKSWEPGMTAFKKVRKKYLLYKDFE